MKTLSLVALAVAPAALAQVVDQPVDESRVQIVSLLPGGYTSRAAAFFNVGTPAESGGAWASSGSVVYDDVTLGGTLPDGTVAITGYVLGIIVPANAVPGTQLFGRFSFYPTHSSSAPSGSSPYAGTPVARAVEIGTFGGTPPWPPPTPAAPLPIAVTLDTTNVFIDGPADRTMGVKIELFLDAALTQRAADWQVVRRANLDVNGTQLALVTGSSDLYAWFGNTAELTNAQTSGIRATYLALIGSLPCGTADFNGDGDFGTDQDIEAFFACLAGNCCATCLPDGADFNRDGDFGTDQDIEAFFRVLAGGNC
jgi:hypothetical protein